MFANQVATLVLLLALPLRAHAGSSCCSSDGRYLAAASNITDDDASPVLPGTNCAEPPSQRMHVGFMLFPERSHFNLLKGIMSELLARGHRVTVVANADRRAWFTNTDLLSRGVTFVPVDPAHQESNYWAEWVKLPMYSWASGVSATRKLVNIARDYSPAALHAFRADRPDIVIGDQILASLYDVEDALGLPVVSAVSTHVQEVSVESVYAPSLGYSTEWNTASEVQGVLVRLKAFAFRYVFSNIAVKLMFEPLLLEHRRSLGISTPHRQPKASLMLEMPADQPMLFTGLQPGFLPARPQSPLIKLVGPCMDLDADLLHSRAAMAPALRAWLDEQPHRPVIYVSMGTVVHMTADQVHALAAALDNPSHRVLWSMRPSQQQLYPQLAHLDPRVFRIEAFVPQLAVLAHDNVRAFFTHGGLSSAIETIRMRKPSLCMGFMGDQPLHCAAMQDRGIGFRINHKNPSVADIQEKIQILLWDEAARSRMTERMAKIDLANQHLGGATAAVDWLEVLHVTGHQHLIPAQLPFITAWNLDVLLAAAFIASAVASVGWHILQQLVHHLRVLLSMLRPCSVLTRLDARVGVPQSTVMMMSPATRRLCASQPRFKLMASAG